MARMLELWVGEGKVMQSMRNHPRSAGANQIVRWLFEFGLSPRSYRYLTSALIFLLVIGLSAPAVWAGGDSFAVLQRITLDDLDIDAMVIDAGHEVVMFDCATARFLRFLEVDRNPATGQFSFNLATDALPIRWDESCAGWLQHDNSNNNTYVLSQHTRDSDDDIDWQALRVLVLKNRQITHNILVNPQGDEPADGPVDFRYSVNGFALKPNDAEAGTAGRLVIDDTVKGNLDIIELEPSGLAATSIQRHSYRNRIDCDWPPEDLPPWRCFFNTLPGNSLALEWLTETALPSPGLTTTDELYLLDPRGPTSVVRRFQLGHSFLPLELQELQSLDITEADTFLGNGARGLTLSPRADRLYVSTRLQSFAQGWLVIADTTNLQQTLVNPVFSDEASPLADRADPDRAFLVVSDSFVPDGPLILRVLRNGVVVDNVTVLDSLPPETPVLAHDPVYGLLYIVVENQLVILQGSADLVFEGSFE